LFLPKNWGTIKYYCLINTLKSLNYTVSFAADDSNSAGHVTAGFLNGNGKLAFGPVVTQLNTVHAPALHFSKRINGQFRRHDPFF
jgi:hypothetical protein